MRLATTTLLILTLAARAGIAQVGGNVGYGQAGGPGRGPNRTSGPSGS